MDQDRPGGHEGEGPQAVAGLGVDQRPVGMAEAVGIEAIGDLPGVQGRRPELVVAAGQQQDRAVQALDRDGAARSDGLAGPGPGGAAAGEPAATVEVGAYTTTPSISSGK